MFLLGPNGRAAALLAVSVLCGAGALGRAPGPVSVALTRQQVPLHQEDGVVHHKSAYYGRVSLGGPQAQTFDVVFDTGSGHLVVPSAICKTETCRNHRRFRRKASQTAEDIDVDGTQVAIGDPRDQITVSYGTGEVTGIFFRDHMCLGDADSPAKVSQEPDLGNMLLQKGSRIQPMVNQTGLVEDTLPDMKPPSGAGGAGAAATPQSLAAGCFNLQFVGALKMTDDPFINFAFDGVVGLGLMPLSQTPKFNFVEAGALAGAWGRDPLSSRLFSVYLGMEPEHQSEITFGGWLPEHMHTGTEHSWCNAINAQDGHWVVKVYGIKANGVRLDFCDDGSCEAIVDTGTSLLGIPSTLSPALFKQLRYVDSSPGDRCAGPGPKLEVDLGNFTVALDPRNYARPEFVPVLGSSQAGEEGGKPCVPMIMEIDLPLPMNPKTLILGEPVLQKYYTAFDTSTPRVGFVEAKHMELGASKVVTV